MMLINKADLQYTGNQLIDDHIDAFKQTIELNRFHNVCVNLKSKKLDLFDVHPNSHFDLIYKIVDLKKDLNKNRWYKTIANWRDDFDDKYTFPIVELNYKSNSKHSIYSYVADTIFFTHENKQEAYDSVIDATKYRLDCIDYLSMTESKLIDFMSKRIIKKSRRKKYPKLG